MTDKKKPSGCYWILLVVVLVALAISVAMNFGLLLGSLVGKGGLTADTKPQDEFPEFTSRWSFGDGETVVVRIPLEGIIARQADGGLFSPHIDKVQMVLDRIRAARNDTDVRGIILEVDSPGGAVTPSDEIYHALNQFRQSADDRRIVVFSRDVSASGAYYAAMAGDWLIAEPTTIVGSIGVMIQTLNWHELSTRVGVHDTTIKSGDSKDLLNPFRVVSEEEIAILQELVDSMYDRFVRIVQDGRGFDDAAMARLADGRIFTAEDALGEGLIDEIGYWDDAVARMAEIMGVPSVKIIRYEHQPVWSDWLVSMRNPLHWSAWSDLERPRVLYLWRP